MQHHHPSATAAGARPTAAYGQGVRDGRLEGLLTGVLVGAGGVLTWLWAWRVVARLGGWLVCGGC